VVVCGGKPAAGVAILSNLRVGVEGVREVKLSKSKDLHQRGAAMAELSLLDLRFTAASVHLGLNSEERTRHVLEVERLIGPVPQSVIGGDLNEGAAGMSWRKFADRRLDAGSEMDLATYPSSLPTKRIDTIFVPTEWKTRSVSLTEITDDATLVRATDHRPVIVDVMGWR
jgi:endonuclease/exonuclease/phosphatase family metal-dependent hydrolase